MSYAKRIYEQQRMAEIAEEEKRRREPCNEYLELVNREQINKINQSKTKTNEQKRKQ